jgi:hypothetical protein
MKYYIAFAISCVLLIGTVLLKVYSMINELSFVTLILVSLLMGIVISVLEKLKSVDLRKGQIMLQDMKNTETSVKEVASATLDVIETSMAGTIRFAEFDSKKFQESVERLKKIST